MATRCAAGVRAKMSRTNTCRLRYAVTQTPLTHILWRRRQSIRGEGQVFARARTVSQNQSKRPPALTTHQFRAGFAQRGGRGRADWRRRAMQRSPRVNQETRLRATFLRRLPAGLASAGRGREASSCTPVETAQ